MSGRWDRWHGPEVSFSYVYRSAVGSEGGGSRMYVILHRARDSRSSGFRYWVDRMAFPTKKKAKKYMRGNGYRTVDEGLWYSADDEAVIRECEIG